METCPDCKLELPHTGGSRHAYLGASASCWALYGELLAREYNDQAYMTAHRMTVDAYCAQHPGKPERRSIQSINLHLVGLYLTIERRLDCDFARSVIGRLANEHNEKFEWLTPPDFLGSVRIDDVMAASTANSHQNLAIKWGESVWKAWSSHHDRIRYLATLAIRADQ